MSTMDFKQFRAALEGLNANLNTSAKKVVSGMADVGLSVAKKNTPVGDYKKHNTAKTYKRGNKKRGIQAGDVMRDKDGNVKRTKYRAVSFTTASGEAVSFNSTVTKIGGTLRRGWKKGRVSKLGRNYECSIYNNTEYGIYVNNGHRIVSKSGATVGYVRGVRMLEQGSIAARHQSESLFREELSRVKQEGGW